MKIIACYSIKGGVGKTAASVNFAHCASKSGYRTLLVDLDPQGASSFYFQKSQSLSLTSKQLLKGKKVLKHIQPSAYPYLDILPSHESYRRLDIRLDSQEAGSNPLSSVLHPLSEDYDVIILDCPPGLTRLAESVFQVADLVLIPVIPTTLSERTMEQLWEFFADHKLGKKRLIPFLSMVNYRTRMHNEVSRRLRATYKRTLRGYIPLSAEIEKMGVHQAPIFAYSPQHIAAKCYTMMWQELEEHLD